MAGMRECHGKMLRCSVADATEAAERNMINWLIKEKYARFERQESRSIYYSFGKKVNKNSTFVNPLRLALRTRLP